MPLVSIIGNLHPAIVHLPIGILYLSVMLEWLMLSRRFRSGAEIIPVITGIGAVSAIAACITGLLLAEGGDYQGDTVENHKWSGIATALIASVYFIFRKKNGFLDRNPLRARMVSLFMLTSVTITGHLGGNLTHGSDFLWSSKTEKSTDAENLIPVANVLEARAYPDLIAPIMKQKCVSCHGPNKQKGGLRLDDETHIKTGGKNGSVIRAGNPGESELYKRLLLPPEDEYHMPPKEKPQLSREDRILIEWWINNGADFSKKVKEIGVDDSTLKILRIYENPTGTAPPKMESSALPEEKVVDADPSLIDQLRNAGVVLLPIERDNGYLMANMVNVDRNVDSLLSVMEPLAPQLVWLKMSGSGLTDAGCRSIAKLERLIKLQVDRTSITDSGIKEISTLRNLQHLNLSGDSISLEGVMALSSIPKLQTINLWNSGIRPTDALELMKKMPSVRIDTGGYVLPFLPSDTMEVRDTRKK
jgi:uncharacterized membrane protein/mono/diheme cytochrome c family protein